MRFCFVVLIWDISSIKSDLNVRIILQNRNNGPKSFLTEVDNEETLIFYATLEHPQKDYSKHIGDFVNLALNGQDPP